MVHLEYSYAGLCCASNAISCVVPAVLKLVCVEKTSQERRPAETGRVVSEEKTQNSAPPEGFEGDYRPSTAPPAETQIRVEPLSTEFLIRLADALNTTLDLQTLLKRTADLVRVVIDYRIFAILLVNDRTRDLRMRFAIGHSPEAERMRIKMGHGIVGQVAQERHAIMVNDVTKAENYINVNPGVRSELAVPLIVKNRVIGV